MGLCVERCRPIKTQFAIDKVALKAIWTVAGGMFGEEYSPCQDQFMNTHLYQELESLSS